MPSQHATDLLVLVRRYKESYTWELAYRTLVLDLRQALSESRDLALREHGRRIDDALQVSYSTMQKEVDAQCVELEQALSAGTEPQLALRKFLEISEPS